KDALDLAAEIGVAGRVDDVDAHVVPHQRRALGQDGDAALALELVRIHGALGDLLVGAEGAALAQELVDQRGLAVVDMGDDGNIPDIHEFDSHIKRFKIVQCNIQQSAGYSNPASAASVARLRSGRAPK